MSLFLRRSFQLCSLGFFLLGASSAEANGWFRRDTVILPSAYVVPTAYFVPTEYVIPTTYVVPATYEYASSLAETSYTLGALSSYVVPTVWTTSRPVYNVPTVYTPSAYFIPTTYLEPVSYVYPTTWAAPVVAFAADPCGGCVDEAPCATEVVRSSATAVVKPRATEQSRTSSALPSTPPVVKSTPKNEEETVGSAVNPPEPPPASEAVTKRDTAPSNNANQRVAPKPTQVEPNLPPKPSVPAEDAGISSLPNPAAATPITPQTKDSIAPVDTTKPLPPKAPGDEPVKLPDNDAAEVKRQVQKPVVSSLPYIRSAQKNNLNELMGKVISTETGRPEEGVRVIASHRLKNFVDRESITDSRGRYKVRLPDGDWTIKVTMPSGRVYNVSQLIVSEGQITDDLGRDIPTLIINR